MGRIASTRFLIERDTVEFYKAPHTLHPFPTSRRLVDPQSNQQNLHRSTSKGGWRTDMDGVTTALE